MSPLQHVQQLRQFVDAEPAQDPADRRDPRIGLGGGLEARRSRPGSEYIERNLRTWMTSLLKPTRGWTNSTGPALVRRISRAAPSMIGEMRSSAISARITSSVRLSMPLTSRHGRCHTVSTGKRADQADAVVGGEVDRLVGDQRDVDADRIQPLHDLVQPGGGQVADADQHLVDLAAAGHVGELVAAADEAQAGDFGQLGPVVGNADEVEVAEVARRQHLAGSRSIEPGSAP